MLQELIVQQHLMRYKRSYRYDAVFALGFVTVYEQLMEGYPSDEDRDAIFQAYIQALKEDPEQYRLVELTIWPFLLLNDQEMRTNGTGDYFTSTHQEPNAVLGGHLGDSKHGFECCRQMLQIVAACNMILLFVICESCLVCSTVQLTLGTHTNCLKYYLKWNMAIWYNQMTPCLNN